MIKAEIISKLTEEYLLGEKTERGYLEIFVNPTRKELNSILDRYKHDPGYDEYIRFCAVSSKQKVYVWHGEMAIHSEIMERLSIKGDGIFKNPYRKKGVLNGVAYKSGSEFVMEDSDMLDGAKYDGDKPYLQNILTADWKWVDRYIKVTPWIEDFRIGISNLF
jgi:hypothetical protein